MADDYRDVEVILAKYRRHLLTALSERVRDNPDRFDSYLFGDAHNVLEEFGMPLQFLMVILQTMAMVRAEDDQAPPSEESEPATESAFQRAPELPQERADDAESPSEVLPALDVGARVVAYGEFLCFHCGATFPKANGECPECGWTWQTPRHWRPAEQMMTKYVRRVLVRAEEEAVRLLCRRVEPEHLLLAILSEPKGRAAIVIGEFAAINYDVLLERIAPPPQPDQPPGARRRAAFGPDVEFVLAEAWGEAKLWETSILGTLHLLAAMTRLIGPPRDRIAELLRVDLEEFRLRLDFEFSTDPGH